MRSSESRTRWWPRAAWWRKRWAGTVGGNGGQSHGRGQGGSRRYLKCSAWPGCLCLDRETDGWAPRGFDFFPIYPKPAQL
jgi:hypothetical protein